MACIDGNKVSLRTYTLTQDSLLAHNPLTPTKEKLRVDKGLIGYPSITG